jgi:hypothetical protein
LLYWIFIHCIFHQKVVSWNAAHGEVHSIQHYMVQFNEKIESWKTGNIGSVNNNIINLVRAEINTMLFWQNIRVTVNVWFLVQIYLRRVKHLNCWYQNVNIHYIKFSKVILQVWIIYSMNTENLTSINWLSFWGKQYQVHFSSTRNKL